jgi:hypothetical protein
MSEPFSHPSPRHQISPGDLQRLIATIGWKATLQLPTSSLWDHANPKCDSRIVFELSGMCSQGNCLPWPRAKGRRGPSESLFLENSKSNNNFSSFFNCSLLPTDTCDCVYRPLVFIVLLSFFLWLSTPPAPSTDLSFCCRHPQRPCSFPASVRVAICLYSGFPLPSLDGISTTLVWQDIHGRHALFPSNFLDPPRISLFARPSLGA